LVRAVASAGSAIPQAINFAVPSGSMMMLAGLMSR
jgi:hypothetical protein